MSTKFPSRRAAARYLLAALPALAALAGCDSREIVAPAARSPAGGPEAYLDVPQPVLLGSYSVPVPPDNGNASSSYAQWAPAGLTIGDSSWVVVRVSGLIHHVDMCGGSTSAGTDLGPLAQTGAGRVMVGYQAGSQQALGSGEELPTYPLYIPLGGNASVAEALTFQLKGVNLWTRRVIFYDKCVTGQAEYALSGTQELSVTQVPKPLKVTGPSTLAAGQTGTYTAQVVGNFRINRSTIRWQFTLLDTLAAEQRYGSGFTRDIPACDTVMVCTYKPDLSGRMGVKADIETAAGVTDKSEVSWVGGPRLQLSCTPSVERAGTASCVVSTNPSTSSLAVTGWTFTDGVYTIRPAAGSTQATATAWGGQIVTGGTVTVNGVAAGRPQSAQAAIAVTTRGWHWGPPQWSFTHAGAPIIKNTEPELADPTPYMGWNCTTGSETLCQYGGWIQPQQGLSPPDSGWTMRQVTDSGPNAGLWYVESASFRMRRGSNLNPQVLPGAPKHGISDPAQEAECRSNMGLGPADPVLVNFYTYNSGCKQVDMENFIARAWNHEEYGSPPANDGHEAKGETEAGRPENDIYAAVEGIVAADDFGVHDAVIQRFDAIEQRVRQAGLTEPSQNWHGTFWIWSSAGQHYVESSRHDF
jgi:hypothetical protein